MNSDRDNDFTQQHIDPFGKAVNSMASFGSLSDQEVAQGRVRWR